MDYRWRGADAQGHDVLGDERTFSAQTEAEAWLSDNWQELLDAGVHHVTLLHGEREVYGPMSLHAAS